jgi:chromosome segregation ATPase
MSTLNDTLEEELRRLLVEKNNECQSLKNHIKLLEKNIKDEQDMKYRAYVKIQDLQDEIKKLS